MSVALETLNLARIESSSKAQQKQLSKDCSHKIEATYKKINSIASTVIKTLKQAFQYIKEGIKKEIHDIKSLINDIKFSIDLIEPKKKNQFLIAAALIAITITSLVLTAIFPSTTTAGISCGIAALSCMVLYGFSCDAMARNHYD